MCEPINNLHYEFDCYQTVTTLGKTEELQYMHYFSLVSTKGMLKNIVIHSDKTIFGDEYILLQGFYPNESKRITRWVINYTSNHKKDVQEPLCYGDRIHLYDTHDKQKIWSYPNKLISLPLTEDSQDTTEWQVCWNDGKLPPKISSNNIIIKEKVIEKNETKETTITVYKKDIGWMVAGSVLIALVIVLLIVLIILSYYISRVWKLKLKDFIIPKKS